MSIAVNTGNTNAVNWEQILSSIGDVKKADSVDGKQSFTITIKGDEGATTITVNIPDDLEIPENVDKSTLQGLVDKLAKSGVGFTDKQIAQMKDSISAYYDEMVKAINNAESSSGTKKSNAMYNLYALMALMIEVAQSQRDAQREIRTSQNLAIQKSFQDQADQQRDAANLGMWVGIACGAFSAVGSLSVMAYQGVTASQQANIVKQTGAEASQMHVSMLQNSDSKVHSQTQLQNTINKVGDGVATEVTQNFQAQIANGGNGNLLNNFNEAVANHNAAKADVQAKTTNLAEQTELLTQRQSAQQIAENQFNAKTSVVDQKQQVVNDKQQVVDQKQQAYDTEVNRVVENETQEAKTARIDAAKAELDTAKAELDTARAELDTARTQFETANAAVEQQTQRVTTAQNDLNLANQRVATTETAMNQARSDYQATVKEVAAQYQEEYQSAVNRLANPQDGDDVAALKADVGNAKAKMEMAFATEADLLAGEGVMTPTERNSLMTATRAKADMAIDSAYRRMDVKALDQRMSKLMTIGNINQSIGGVLQTMAAQLSSIKGSEATRQQAETTKQEEMLDQTKDLFSKAQNLIDQAIQLYKAVIQAENQSMRDAIQA